MSVEPKLSIIVVAAGAGTRMGGVLKQYMPLLGAPVLRHGIERMTSALPAARFVIVHGDGQSDICRAAMAGFEAIPVRYVTGGATRADSVAAGLSALSADDTNIVFIHDAARPLVDAAALRRLFDAARSAPNATLALPVVDTLWRASDNTAIDRNGAWAVQTPQAFDFKTLLQAYAARTAEDAFTDDCGLVLAKTGHAPVMVLGAPSHRKLTNPEDMPCLETLLLSEYADTRTAQGFDVHAFDTPSENADIRLCGVDVPSFAPLVGHSDADAGLHALCDALYACVGDGDIGVHFPPSEPKWRGADSCVFLNHALARLKSARGVLTHAGVTIVGEKPKITPVREAILTRLETLLCLPRTRIGLTATTTEKLGFLGRSEGIACFATVTARFKP